MFVFNKWNIEDIQKISRDGWFKYDDGDVEKEVLKNYKMWKKIYNISLDNTNDKQEICQKICTEMRLMIDAGQKDIVELYYNRKYIEIFKSYDI